MFSIAFSRTAIRRISVSSVFLILALICSPTLAQSDDGGSGIITNINAASRTIEVNGLPFRISASARITQDQHEGRRARTLLLTDLTPGSPVSYRTRQGEITQLSVMADDHAYDRPGTPGLRISMPVD